MHIRIFNVDQEGMTLFAVHYSINKPVPGVSAGDYNFDVRSPTGDDLILFFVVIYVAVVIVVSAGCC